MNIPPIYPFMRHKNVNFFPYPVFQNGNIENQLKRIREFEPHDDAVLMCSPWKSGKLR